MHARTYCIWVEINVEVYRSSHIIRKATLVYPYILTLLLDVELFLSNYQCEISSLGISCPQLEFHILVVS